MEVDANTVICYKCYKEGHMRNECRAKEQAPYRKVVYTGERKKKAATISASSTDKGKAKEEFVQGSSTKGEVGSSEEDSIKGQLEALKLQYGRLMDILTERKEDF